MGTTSSTQEIVSRLRSSPYINEKKFDTISSFNFTRKAFISSHWNELTLRARGLFIDTSRNKIVARGYDKFFNIDETVNSSMKHLKRYMKFPAFAYKKENGFLGLISTDPNTGDLLFASKSTIGGDYAKNLERIFMSSVIQAEHIRSVLEHDDATMLVEVIDPVNDPHIIEYEKEKVVLLDIVSSKWSFEHIPYASLKMYASCFGMECKRLDQAFYSWEEFESFVSKCQQEEFTDQYGKHIEGYVIEDSAGNMVKLKTDYYRKWKYRRTAVQRIQRGKQYFLRDDFLEWFSAQDTNESASIITLRNKYEADLISHKQKVE